jgi:hypothetical protein
MEIPDMTYYRLYLKNYLREQDDVRADDEEFVESRSNRAEEMYEQGRREGLAVWQAQERAIRVLTEDLND